MIEFSNEPFENFYEVGDEIGSGQFAVVKKCKHIKSQVEYAAKFIRKRRTAASRRGAKLDDIHKEVELLSEINHETIIKLYDVYESRTEVVLVLELVSGGELFDFIAEKEKLSEEEASAFIKQILHGVRHMHDKNIVHLDLKPENVMLTSKQSQKIKLIDFGLSRKLLPDAEIREMMGTPEFVAPEVINFEPLHLNSDMWSIGVITYILLSGASPFLGDDKQETFRNVTAVDYRFDDDLFASTSDLAKDFIKKLFVKDPRKRLSVHESLRHPWIQPIEKKQREARKKSHINIDNLKAFTARKRWKQSLRVVSLCNRLSRSMLLRRSGDVVNSTKSIPSVGGEEEDNFVLTALFCATEDGNFAGIKRLLSMTSLDINISNRHGETALHRAASGGHVEVVKLLQSNGMNLNVTDQHGDNAVYWAARQGHVEVVKYLKEQGVSVDQQNKSGESALHVAARYGHSHVVQYLCEAGANVDLQDELGETALHSAAWHGFSIICTYLCNAGCQLDVQNKDGEVPIHNAAGRGYLECVKVLLNTGARLDLYDKRGSSALHWACRRHHTAIAMQLVQAGCPLDVVDETGESAIHAAAHEGLFSVVQAMCAYGCDVNIISKNSLTALHSAAKGGYLEIVRCLLLAGADPDVPNKDGVIAEILALAQGHSEIADLLIRMKPDRRVNFINQLVPTRHPLKRIKLKVFGSSGVGKTTLISSLKCGYITGFFRRRITSTSAMLAKSHWHQNHHRSHVNGLQRHRSLPSQLSYEVRHDHYTKGIDVQLANISVAGDLSIWEFSGYEPYYMLYDNFIGDINCVHTVLFSLADPPDIRRAQVAYWLNFIRARIQPLEPIGHCGKQANLAKIVLIATHADRAMCFKNSRGEFVNAEALSLLNEMRQRFWLDFDISESMFVLDANSAMSNDMKAFRHYLADLKMSTIQHLPTTLGFTDAMVAQLPSWRRSSSSFPVLSWQQFVEYARAKVNPLASEEHLKTLIQQLQLMGEVIYLETDSEQDLVILSPKWLCHDVIGGLLSHDRIVHTRPTGCYTVDDFQMMFPEADALDLLQVLQAVEMCVQCENDGDIEYEFPCLNFVETLRGLWESDSTLTSYGGVRLQSEVPMQLKHIFPKVQVQLRRSIQSENQDPDNDLYQWYHGSKFCCGLMEGMITLEDFDAIDIKVRGPSDSGSTLYYFLDDLVSLVEQVFIDACPGLFIERQLLSSAQLQRHSLPVHAYSNTVLLKQQLLGELEVTYNGTKERFFDVLCLHSEEVEASLTLGIDLHVSALSLHTRRHLSSLLDIHDHMGRDWCLLAVNMGMTDALPRLDSSQDESESKTDKVLQKWSKEAGSTIGQLILKLQELGRQDAVDVLLYTAPAYRVSPLEEQSQDGLEGAGTQGYNSTNTVSDLSR
ncbi:death-associated protein kinase 1 isoform X2 [Lingula anatina]|uniref:Death-associated protein kinase 1 isoform X2 n=1 Tax=Lingula anatina TaxID=7574 RepID=A0A1S3HV42_LINAN|nr:death-associated protein kinase 1 isoform X2 [Lingula anatina]|eukprot:XP_013389888.1 death-associated protein kinase 1 isoform X2 [Lingula anatina]